MASEPSLKEQPVITYQGPSLAGRAFLAVALLIGFYILAIGIAILLFFIPIIEWTSLHRVHFQIALFCWIGAFIIVRAIIPRADKFTPPGPHLQPEQQPKLFETLTTVAQRTGQEMPSEVYLVPDVNAWVSQRGGVMGFGSRRIMGLGLPLLQIVTVSQLEAVLAHEFGHYYGGDTKLGPWIYKTRNAIVRSIHGLAQHSSWLYKPFEWYGLMFLRITHAISRRQEFVADALAARIAGARALIGGLQAIHGGAMAFNAYWHMEVMPVLEAGKRPPLVEGFNRFVSSSAVSSVVARSVEVESAQGKADPYDTHPSLQERIAAAQKLPAGGEQPANDAKAITLLTNARELER